jgi:hypothetical protein
MTTFNEGDKLEVVTACGSHLTVGATGTVTTSGWFLPDNGGSTHEIRGYQDHFKLVTPVVAPTLEVGKTYKLTADPTTWGGSEAFVGSRPKPTEVTIISLRETGSNIYVVAGGVHAWISKDIFGEEVVAAPEAEPLNVVVGGEYAIKDPAQGTFWSNVTKVRVIQAPSRICQDSNDVYARRLDGEGSEEQYVYPRDLSALPAEEPTVDEIKVGDKVEITRRPDGDTGAGARYIGKTGEAVRLFAAGDFIGEPVIRVMLDASWTEYQGTNGVAFYADQVKKVEPKELEILVGGSYKLLPGAFTNEGTNETPRLRGYVGSTWKDGHPSVGVRSAPMPGNGNVEIRRPGGFYQTVHRSFLAPLDEAPATTDAAAASAATDALNTRIKDLESRVERLRGDLTTERENHRTNISKISEKFMEEAESRGWCDEYDTFVEDEVNPYITVEMETRRKEYEVTFTFTQTITVTATSEDDAVELAREDDDYKSSGEWGDGLDEDNYSVSEA